MITEIKNGYEVFKLNTKFITKKIFFAFWIPIFPSTYTKLKNEVIASNKNIDWEIGMIEKPKFFGYGFIGLSQESGDTTIEGNFIKYTMVGDYTQFRKNWKKIIADYPTISEAYHIYKTDPSKTKKEENITFIIFR